MLPLSANKIKFLESLERHLGIVTDAAKDCGLSRTEHYEWLKCDPDYKKAVDELYQVEADFVVRNLMKNVNSGDQAAINTWLKYKGRRAGFTEKTEIDVNVSGTIKFDFVNTEETKEEEK